MASFDSDNLRNRYGGINWGSAFFGWLVTAGIGTLLTALLAAAGSAVYLSTPKSALGKSLPTVGLTSGLLLLIALAIAYYCGGYVAGRMSRFDGARQGFGVWAFGVILTVLLGVAGYLFGAKYNVAQTLGLPNIPVHQAYTTAGLITLLLVLLVTLAAAVLGGIAGLRYHSEVNRATDDLRTVEPTRAQQAFGERVERDRYRD